MITIIFGKPGAGKTSLMAHLIEDLYIKKGRELLKTCEDLIVIENESRLYPLPLPQKPPIFANFEVEFLAGYQKKFSPYFFNPYYFGIENDEFPVQHILPGGAYFIDEGQRYFNSRKSGSFPDHVSRAFEVHRHFKIDIYIGVQRPKLIDLNIRELTPRFWEIIDTQNETNGYGGVTKTTWTLREFSSDTEVMERIQTGEGGRQLPPIVHDGNIFESFNSFEQKKLFFPKDEKNAGFTLLPFRPAGELPEKLKEIYNPGEPKWYRKSEK